jgi:hypothetical protein
VGDTFKIAMPDEIQRISRSLVVPPVADWHSAQSDCAAMTYGHVRLIDA